MRSKCQIFKHGVLRCERDQPNFYLCLKTYITHEVKDSCKDHASIPVPEGIFLAASQGRESLHDGAVTRMPGKPS